MEWVTSKENVEHARKNKNLIKYKPPPTYIIILTDYNPRIPILVGAWSALTILCRHHGLPYHYLKSKKFPFEYKSYRFDKVRMNEKN